MGKIRNLNGLPNNLAKSYLSTLYYYDGGYMGDWIYYLAIKYDCKEIVIDILNKSIEPKVTEVKPLILFIDYQQEIIEREVSTNGFGQGFIRKAELRFQIQPEETNPDPVVCCYPRLEDDNGRVYTSEHPIIERVYPKELLKRIT